MQFLFSKKFFILLAAIGVMFIGVYYVGSRLNKRYLLQLEPTRSTIIVEFVLGTTEAEIVEIANSIRGHITDSPYSLSPHERAIEVPLSDPDPVIKWLKERYAPKVKDANLQLTPLRPA